MFQICDEGGEFNNMVKRFRPKGEEGGGVFKVYDEPESPHEDRV